MPLTPLILTLFPHYSNAILYKIASLAVSLAVTQSEQGGSGLVARFTALLPFSNSETIMYLGRSLPSRQLMFSEHRVSARDCREEILTISHSYI